MMRVGYYVHHHGAGHRTRASIIAGTLRTRGHDVTLLGSWAGAAVILPRDDDGTTFREPEAHGALHWAPLQHSGYQDRMATIARWIQDMRPDVLVVDVSVEVTSLARLLGVPVVVVAQPGQRDDAPHTLAYRLASTILAPWPAIASPCVQLHDHGAKVRTVGGISRFTGPAGAGPSGPVVLLGGADGLAGVPDVRDLFPHSAIVEVGGHHWRDDVDDLLAAAFLVVGHTGQNSVADLAALAKPLIMVPQDRPHNEQRCMAEELDQLKLAVMAPGTTDTTAWQDAVSLARTRAQHWQRWETTGSAERAAAAIEETAHG